MHQLNYTFLPERPLDIPLYRKGWRPAKPRPRPYPKPAASVGAAAIIASRRQSREDPRHSTVPALPVQFNDVRFSYALAPERPLDRKARRPVKPKPRPYPKPVTNVGVSRRRLRENARPLISVPPFQNVAVLQDNYGFPPPVAGYVPESDDMEIDTMGPAFILVAPNATYVNPLIVGYTPELPEAMEVDWEGPSIPTGPSYHPAFNIPPPPIMVENARAVNLENPHNFVIGAYHALPPNAGLVDPPYDPRQPFFTTQPILNAGVQVVEDNVFVGININAQVPTHTVQPHFPETLNTPPVAAAEEHPGDNTELFNELFGEDGEEEDEEDIAPWSGGGGNQAVGGHGNDEDEDEDEVEIII